MRIVSQWKLQQPKFIYSSSGYRTLLADETIAGEQKKQKLCKSFTCTGGGSEILTTMHGGDACQPASGTEVARILRDLLGYRSAQDALAALEQGKTSSVESLLLQPPFVHHTQCDAHFCSNKLSGSRTAWCCRKGRIVAMASEVHKVKPKVNSRPFSLRTDSHTRARGGKENVVEVPLWFCGKSSGHFSQGAATKATATIRMASRVWLGADQKGS